MLVQVQAVVNQREKHMIVLVPLLPLAPKLKTKYEQRLQHLLLLILLAPKLRGHIWISVKFPLIALIIIKLFIQSQWVLYLSTFKSSCTSIHQLTKTMDNHWKKDRIECKEVPKLLPYKRYSNRTKRNEIKVILILKNDFRLSFYSWLSLISVWCRILVAVQWWKHHLQFYESRTMGLQALWLLPREKRQVGRTRSQSWSRWKPFHKGNHLYWKT